MIIKSLVKLSDFVISILIIIVSVILLATVSSGVLFRYVINRPLLWANEIATYALIWWVFIGTAFATRKGKHISVEFFKSRLSNRFVAWLELIIYLILILYCLILSYYSINLLPRVYVQVASFTRISVTWFYIIIPICSIIMIIYLIDLIIELIQLGKQFSKTLHGCIIKNIDSNLLIYREFGKKLPLNVTLNEDVKWDNRFRFKNSVIASETKQSHFIPKDCFGCEMEKESVCGVSRIDFIRRNQDYLGSELFGDFGSVSRR